MKRLGGQALHITAAASHLPTHVHRLLALVRIALGQRHPCTLNDRWNPEQSSLLPTCTTSLRLCTSPLGSGTYSSASRSNSVA